jgi:hypothetical protein
LSANAQELVNLKDEHRKQLAKRDYQIQSLKGYILEFVTRLPDAQKLEALTRDGAIVNSRFQEALPGEPAPYSYEAARDVIALMFRTDQNNGHGLYFAGEIDWHRHANDMANWNDFTNFYTYLEEEEKVAPKFRKGEMSVMACRNPRGYCQQRTAWIDHLLANYLYQRATREEQRGSHAAGTWAEALVRTCDAKILYRHDGKDGFEQLTPTDTLEQEIRKRLPTKKCRQRNEASDFFGSAPFAPAIIDAN